MTDQESRNTWDYLQKVMDQVTQQSWQRWQRLLAGLELATASRLQVLRQRVLEGIENGDPDSLTLVWQTPDISPRQWEVLIASLPQAQDRARVARQLALAVLTEGSRPDREEWLTTCRRAYALSGMPLLLDTQGHVDVTTSAQVVTAVLMTRISSASLTWIVAFLGGKTLRKLGIKEPSIPELAADQGDPWLQLTQAGVQVSQLSEFVALRIQSVLNTGIGFIPPLVPYQPILELIRWLTSDPLLSISNLTEFSLVAASQERRLELLCEQWDQQQRLPSPPALDRGIPPVMAEVDRSLRQIIAKQLLLLADVLDPQERSDWINDLGRQWNVYNPMQYLQGWTGQDWLAGLEEQLNSLRTSYPTLSLWQDYCAGVARAKELPRLMDQAAALRQTSQILDASLVGQASPS
ncbi:MAG: hypothetical protein OHK0012_27100 [Synechococcales cyanobacterium]